MAISAPHYRLLKSLQPILPRGGSLLEIGEANWYGDLNPRCLLEDTTDPSFPDRLEVAMELVYPLNLFAIAKLFYETLFAPSKIVSIDMNGTTDALRIDLNKSIWAKGQKYYLSLADGKFDLVINHGTAEHVFNIAQVFETMHERCKTGGLMIHESPFTGWVDHGFYNLNPTLFYDLAATNGYEMVFLAMHSTSDRMLAIDDRAAIYKLTEDGQIPDNAVLFVALRKMSEEPFKVPVQGYYAGTIGKSGEKAWRELR